MAALVAERSDAIPGVFVCCECRQQLGNIMESWRRTSDSGGSFATLFCAHCGDKLRQLGLDVSPIQLTNIDLLNLGQPIAI